MKRQAVELSDDTFTLLLALSVGEELSAEDGKLTISLPGGRPEAIESLEPSLDSLEDNKFVAITSRGVLVTATGEKVLRAWMKKRYGTFKGFRVLRKKTAQVRKAVAA